MGSKTFAYSSFGEVVYEQDAEQAEHPNSPANYTFYDPWGRVTKKLTNSYISGGLFEPVVDGRSYLDTYDYSTACSFGSNVLCGRYRSSNYNSISESHEDDFYIAHSMQYSYEKFGRIASEVTEMPNVLGDYQGSDGNLNNSPSLKTSYFYYEDHNLPKQTIHDNIRGLGLSVVNHYDAYGSLVKQVENPSNQTLMEVSAWNLRGQPLVKVLNDNSNLLTTYEYYSGTGQVKRILNSATSSDQSFDYSYDAWGNIHAQTLNDSVIETFKYDQLQRLKESHVAGQQAISYEYDDEVGSDSIGLGNMMSKSDYASNHRYQQTGNAGPNAITSVDLNSGGTLSYAYDKNGNRIHDTINGVRQANYTYDAYNLLIASDRPTEAQQVSYLYGIDNLRYAKHENTFNANANGQGGDSRREITLYMGPQFEQVINTTTHEIEAKFQLTDYLTITLNNANIQTRHFTQKDRLGSTTQILDENGVKLHTKGYDAFGKPRNGDNWSPLIKPVLDFESSGSVDITKRGFTDHEHLDAFELIHMNGRMYDFNNGRFLSVDPFIQGTTSQAINPYSYIHNNPLSGVDPTGYLIRELNSAYGCNTTHGGGCAQDGNIFAQAQSLRNKAASFNGMAPSGIGVRKGGTEDVSDNGSQENVNHCSGVLTCYKYERDTLSGEFVLIEGEKVTEFSEYNFLNCILNEADRAGRALAPVHLDASLIEEDIDSFVLIHNPTEKMLRDGAETFRDKFSWLFGHTDAAIQLSGLINQANAKGKNFNIVAHSQGTAILKSAIKHHQKKRKTQLSNLRVRLHGPAVNVSLAKRTFRKSGVRMFGANGGVNINSGDAVPNILGANTMNPWHLLKSLFLSPTLSSKVSDWSPHTFPVNCSEEGCK